jgi:hypothetical protein
MSQSPWVGGCVGVRRKPRAFFSKAALRLCRCGPCIAVDLAGENHVNYTGCLKLDSPGIAELF